MNVNNNYCNLLSCFSIVLTLSRLVVGTELTFDLADSARQCFYEDIEKNITMVMEYQVVSGGQHDIDVVLEGPHEKVLYKKIRSEYDSYRFSTEEAGVYSVCFSNEFSTFTHKQVFMGFQTAEEKPLLPSLQNHATALTMMESTAQEIHRNLNDVIDYQTHHRLREAQGRKRAEELNERVLWWSLTETFAILVICIAEVFVLRNFFTDRSPSQLLRPARQPRYAPL